MPGLLHRRKEVVDMTALQYIYDRMDEDFPKEAPAVKHMMANQMRELGVEETLSSESDQEELATQSQLNAFVYPYLTCVKALVRQGTERASAISYASRLWKEMPESIRDMIDSEHLETMQRLFQTGRE